MNYLKNSVAPTAKNLSPFNLVPNVANLSPFNLVPNGVNLSPFNLVPNGVNLSPFNLVPNGVNLSPFNWPHLITQITNEAIHGVFKKLFLATDLGDKSAKEETTKAAFQIMIDAINKTKSIEESLKDKSVHEIFDLVNLAEGYKIPELLECVRNHLSYYPVTDDTVLTVASEALEYTSEFEKEAEHLLITCATFLKPKLKDADTIFSYVANNKDRKEVVATLLALMNEVGPVACNNCRNVNCQAGEEVKEDEFRKGIVVRNNRANGVWDKLDYGTGKVIKVEEGKVFVETIEPGVTRDGVTGTRFNDRGYPKVYNGMSIFLFSCK